MVMTNPLEQYGVLSKGRCVLMHSYDYIWAYSSLPCDISEYRGLIYLHSRYTVSHPPALEEFEGY